jgi:hypothetical protein
VLSWLPGRGADHRALVAQNREWPGNIVGRYAGIGIAMETLIENTVRVTIRHSDSEPIASVAATASVNREQATGAERPLKPQAPCDRIMAEIPSRRGRITRDTGKSRSDHRQYCGGSRSKMAKWRRKFRFCPLFQQLCPLFWLPRPRRRRRPGRRRQRPGANPWRRSRGSARPAATMRGSPGRSRGRNRSGRRHGCSHKPRYPRP